MEEDIKMSFFKRVLISIKDFDKYKIFVIEKLGKSIKYAFILALILMIFIAASFTVKYGSIIDNTLNYIKQDLPDFTYENGNLNFNIDEPLVLENGESQKNISYKVIIDTKEVSQEKIDEYKQKIGLYNYGIVILKDKLIINSSLVSQTIEQNYKELGEKYGIVESFNKQNMIDYINSYNIVSIYVQIFILLYIYLFASYFITMLLDAILLAILGIITSRIARVQIKFSGLYSIGLHALTLPIILNVIYIIVNTFTGFYIKYFDIMYTTVSYIYIVAAILSMKSDLIKQQIEIGKINNSHDVNANTDGKSTNSENRSNEDGNLNDPNNDNKDSNKNKENNKQDKDQTDRNESDTNSQDDSGVVGADIINSEERM